MKTCFKCRVKSPLNNFYHHKQMTDGHLGKCIPCTRKDMKLSNGTEKRNCLICKKQFNTWITEIRRGGGLTCSRECYFKRLRQIIGREEDSHNWKGDNVGKPALHDWIRKKLGKPQRCEHCGTQDSNTKYDWANKTQKYKRDVKDWLRLCRACHAKYDYSVRIKKWRLSVSTRHGWNVKK